MTTDQATYPHDLAGDPADAPTNPTPEEIAAARDRDTPDVGLYDVTVFGAAPYRLAGCLAQLRDEANAANAGRDKRSDGWIGDLAHASRASDHNPDRNGFVCALDLDVDGLDLATAFERIRQRVAAGELPWLADGYLILNRRITRPDWSAWNVYTGPDPHTGHGHASCTHRVELLDNRGAYGVFVVAGPAPVPAPAGFPGPDLAGVGTGLRGDQGNNGERVRALQTFFRDRYPLYAKHLVPDGWWGPKTSAVIAEFGHRSTIPSADGLNVGPKLAAALTRAGFSG